MPNRRNTRRPVKAGRKNTAQRQIAKLQRELNPVGYTTTQNADPPKINYRSIFKVKIRINPELTVANPKLLLSDFMPHWVVGPNTNIFVKSLAAWCTITAGTPYHFGLDFYALEAPYRVINNAYDMPAPTIYAHFTYHWPKYQSSVPITIAQAPATTIASLDASTLAGLADKACDIFVDLIFTVDIENNIVPPAQLFAPLDTAGQPMCVE